MKLFSLLSVALLFFAVACSDSPAPGSSLTAPHSALLASGTGNSPPPPVDAYVEGDAGGSAFTADGTYFSNEESVSAAVAQGSLSVAAGEEKSHAWLKLNDDATNPSVDVSSSAQIKRQAARLSGTGTFTITEGANVTVIRIETVEKFVSNPDCGTSRFCGTIEFTSSISVNGGPFVGNQPGRMRIYNDQFPNCGEACDCQPTNCG